MIANPMPAWHFSKAMEDTCGNIEVASVQGWIRHARRYFPRCLARENVSCDVDEVLWPDPARRSRLALVTATTHLSTPTINSWTAPRDPTHTIVFFTVYMFMVLLYTTVYNSNVWPNKYIRFPHCIGVYSVLVTPLSRLLSL